MQALWIVCLLAAATCAAESRRPVLRAAPTAVTTGNYVVVLRKNTTTETLYHLLSKASKYTDDAKIHRYAETVAKAFTLKLSPYSLEVVSHIEGLGIQGVHYPNPYAITADLRPLTCYLPLYLPYANITACTNPNLDPSLHGV